MTTKDDMGQSDVIIRPNGHLGGTSARHANIGVRQGGYGEVLAYPAQRRSRDFLTGFVCVRVFRVEITEAR